MLRFKHLSLSLQLPLIAAAAALLVGLCVLWLAARSSSYLQSEREKLFGESLAQQIALSVSEPLQRGDLLSARASLQRFIDSSLASGVDVRDVEGMPMGAAGSPTLDEAHQYRAAIRIGGDIAGHVLVSVDDSSGRESRWRFTFSLLALTAALSLLVFVTCRALALRFTARLQAVQSQLQLDAEAPRAHSDNELTALQQSVERLPLDMLRGHATVPAAATDFRRGSIVFIHLASLVRYVDTLSESNLHRYSRRLQQIVQAAAHCYRGELSVTRPFGLLITFSPQTSGGGDVLRAVSCARLIALIATSLEKRTRLSLDMAMAVGPCEEGADDADDFYPQLHLHGAIDELRDICLQQEDFPAVQVASGLLDDPQLDGTAVRRTDDADTWDFAELLNLSPQQESLLTHQAEIIVERIKPAPR